jgi:integral membrane protein
MSTIGNLWRFYRTMAFLVGGVLAVLVFVAAPYRHLVLGHETAWYQYAWMAHGYLFPVYVIATFLLGQALRWPIGKILLVMVAGTVPLMSFVAERKVKREVLSAS